MTQEDKDFTAFTIEYQKDGDGRSLEDNVKDVLRAPKIHVNIRLNEKEGIIDVSHAKRAPIRLSVSNHADYAKVKTLLQSPDVIALFNEISTERP